ncbi:histidine kinase dimerization/phospho-acceptor domain-containing protein, partial [uncultured Alistipes sp.]
EYITTDYIPFNKDKIVYRLEGFSNTWSNLEQNVITYTNLNPGKYTLVVKAKDADERLVPPSRLQIEVLPPFYHTVWAYVLYLTCIAGIACYLVRTYYRRIQLQESLKYEQKHAEDIEKLNQAKLRFFTNISHEFRTPLTLIIGQMEMLLQMRSFAPNIYNKILKAYKSSLQLRELITELLDFRKQEQGYMTIKVSEHNIVDFVYEHYLFFQEYAAQRRITFNFEKSSDYINVWYDARQMQKVINNLISNAFKHTKAGGTISISIRKRN